VIAGLAYLAAIAGLAYRIFRGKVRARVVPTVKGRCSSIHPLIEKPSSCRFRPPRQAFRLGLGKDAWMLIGSDQTVIDDEVELAA
jgi:hypothetical protein